MTKGLDFFVVGAQKAGTTALFHYLDQHPALFFPPEKEAPFFSLHDRYAQGLQWYLREYFHGARDDQQWGTVSPQYMCATYIPERIRSTVPGAKIIAVLRDPVERCISHYRMLRIRGMTGLDPEPFFGRLLESTALRTARSLEIREDNEARCCVVWSEYGRLLTPYFELFDSSNILLIGYDEFRHEPGTSIDAVLALLGLPSGFRPPDIGTPYFENPWDPLHRLSRVLAKTPARGIWHRLSTTSRFRVRTALGNGIRRYVRRQIPQIVVSPELRSALRSHFEADRNALSRVFGRPDPWLRASSAGE